jgi:hypothetical protein
MLLNFSGMMSKTGIIESDWLHHSLIMTARLHVTSQSLTLQKKSTYQVYHDIEIN